MIGQNIESGNAFAKRAQIVLTTLAFFFLLCNNAVAAASTATTTPAATDTPATNMVVDFSATTFPSEVHRGDSKVLNLVIKNTGGYKGENIEVLLPSSGAVKLDKKFFVGRMDPGESKIIPVIFSIPETSRIGLSAIQVKISFDGYKSDGELEKDQLTTWEIPMTIIGNPLFEMTPQKLTFYKGSLSYLNITGLTREGVGDLEVTLSSNCLDVMSSTKQYVGKVEANRAFILSYPIKPSANGACLSSLKLSYTVEDGQEETDNVSFGLNIVTLEAVSMDYKIATTPLSPGKRSDLNITLRNTGNTQLENVKFSWTTDKGTILPLNSDNTKHVKFIGINESVELIYDIIVDSNADPGLYKLQLILTYDDPTTGNSGSIITTDAGIYIGGSTEFEIAFSDSQKGETSFSVANTGSNTAYSVDVSIPKQDGWTVNGPSSLIIGNLNKGDYTTVSYKLVPEKTAGEYPLNIQIEYTDTSGNRQTVNRQVSLDTSMITAETVTSNNTTNGGPISPILIVVAAVVLILVAAAYKNHRKKKK